MFGSAAIFYNTLVEAIIAAFSPVLSNFHVKNGEGTKVYFDSSSIITATTTAGFTITDKTISNVTINTGQLTGHYFTVSVAFNYYSNNTIRYNGTDDFNGPNAVYAFDLRYITNNIAQPATTSEKFVAVGVSGSGNSVGDPMVWSDAQSVAAGTKVYWAKGNYGSINFVQATSGT